MQTGISQLIMPGATTEDFLRQSAQAGYQVVELSLKQEGALTPDISDKEIAGITSLANDLGLKIVSVALNHCTGNLLDAGESAKTAIAQTAQGIEIARKLGAGHVLHTLGRLEADLYYDEAYHSAVVALKEIAETCQKHNVKLAIEFVWNGFLFSPLEMRHFLDEIDSSWIGFYFDPGNMAVFQFPQHWVRIVGKRTLMVHLKDWRGNALNGGWTPLLEGAINRELRAIGYDGPMISEVVPQLCPIDKTARAIEKIIKM